MTDQTEPSTETSSSETEPETGNREAAKWRRQLRDTEAERDQLRSTIDAMRRRAIEDTAARDHRVAKPESLWVGADGNLNDMLDDNGMIDPDKTNTWITERVSALGLAQKRSGPYVPREGGNPRPAASATTWGQFLNNPEN